MTKRLTPITVGDKKYFIEDQKTDDKKRDGIFQPGQDKVYEDTNRDGRLTKDGYNNADPNFRPDAETHKIDGVNLGLFHGAKIDQLQSFFDARNSLANNPLATTEDFVALNSQLVSLQTASAEALINPDNLSRAYGTELVDLLDRAMTCFLQVKRAGFSSFVENLQTATQELKLPVDWPEPTPDFVAFDDMLVTADGAEDAGDLSPTQKQIMSALDASAKLLGRGIKSDFYGMESDIRIAMVGSGLRIDARLQVGADGMVTEVDLGDLPESVPQEFQTALIARFKAQRLPATGEEVIVNYPVSFGQTAAYEFSLQQSLERAFRSTTARLELPDDFNYETRVTMFINENGRIESCDAEPTGSTRHSNVLEQIENDLRLRSYTPPPPHLVKNGVARMTVKVSVFNSSKGGSGIKFNSPEATQPHRLKI